MNPAWKKIQEDLVETVRILIKQEKEKGDVRSQATYKYRFKEDTSSEFAALFTADVVTPKNRATPAPGYPIFLTAN